MAYDTEYKDTPQAEEEMKEEEEEENREQY